LDLCCLLWSYWFLTQLKLNGKVVPKWEYQELDWDCFPCQVFLLLAADEGFAQAAGVLLR
jgi:hypothetical protein